MRVNILIKQPSLEYMLLGSIALEDRVGYILSHHRDGDKLTVDLVMFTIHGEIKHKCYKFLMRLPQLCMEMLLSDFNSLLSNPLSPSLAFSNQGLTPLNNIPLQILPTLHSHTNPQQSHIDIRIAHPPPLNQTLDTP